MCESKGEQEREREREERSVEEAWERHSPQCNADIKTLAILRSKGSASVPIPNLFRPGKGGMLQFADACA